MRNDFGSPASVRMNPLTRDRVANPGNADARREQQDSRASASAFGEIRSLVSQYYGIRKVEWDALWHALYTTKGRETYDRVTKRQAQRILHQLQRNP